MLQRHRLLDLAQPLGLALTGPSTAHGPRFLRHARGLHETCVGELRTRTGKTLVFSTGSSVHSLTRFNDLRFHATGTTLYRNNVALSAANDGTALTLLRIPPGNTQPDSLFWVGGGIARKVDTAGTVSFWGIDPPVDGFTATKAAQNTKDIELFEDHTSFTLAGTGATKANEATIKQFGSNSIKVSLPADTIATLTKTVSLNLTTYGAVASPDEDLIEFWLRVDNSQHSDYVTFRFDVGAGDFSSNYYQYKFVPTGATPRGLPTDTVGVGALPEVAGDEADFISSEGSPLPADTLESVSTGPGTTAYGASSATWTRLHVPKALFMRSGSSTNTWANVAAIQLQFRTTPEGAADFYVDRARLVGGGAGMLGKYEYLVTFRNTTTGHRSNANPTAVVVQDVERQSVALASLPVSTDAQVNQREVWRTMGDGSAFFRAPTVDNNSTLTATDAVADFIGMDSTSGAPVLANTELPTDNTRPEDTHEDAIYVQGVVFWISGASGKKGRVYYSPSGRPEAQKGFIDVTDDDDPLLRLVDWNGLRYAISEGGFYRIDGSDPYTSRRVYGVPGVLVAQARTVVPTPLGVVWQAADGLRLFDGSASALVLPDRLTPIFRGEAAGQFTQFEGTSAAYARDQYFISDGSQGLAINLTTGFVRDLGEGFASAYFEDDTGLLLVGTASGVYLFEDEDAAPVGSLDVETNALDAAPGTTPVAIRLYIDAVGNGQSVTPTLILDGVESTLPPFTIADRGTVEYALGRRFSTLAVRLTASSLTRHVSIYDVALDVYVPQTDAERQTRTLQRTVQPVAV